MNIEEIIIKYSKNDFMNFLKNDYDGKILELFNAEGLNILKKYRYKEERIAYILTYSRYKNELFKNGKFLEVFFKSDITYYYASLDNLDDETYDFMLEKYYGLNPSPENFARLFSYFNSNYKTKKLDNWKYGTDVLYYLVSEDSDLVVSKILNDFEIDLADNRINIERLSLKAKESVLKAQEYKIMHDKDITAIYIPVHMVNANVAKKLLDKYDIFEIRSIINNLEFSTNPENANNYIKKFEEHIINSYNPNILIYPYNEIYHMFSNMKEAEVNQDDAYFTYRSEYINLLNKFNNNIYYTLEEIYNKNKITGIFDYLKHLSDKELSNYIIDYNFEENYHNIMLDVRELLRFYYDGNVIIKSEHVDLYEKISNIDYLSIEEKIELHNILKVMNIQEIFYDDMSMARHVVKESIKESSLTRDSIKKYRDDELSEEHGVDVYVMNDEPFFGIVKSGEHLDDNLPVGHSYSLVGNDCIATFGDPMDSNTFLYDASELNPEQIVHVFPFDSFTLYRPYNSVDNATNRVFTLMMPEEITGLSANTYSELLILEQGKTKTDIDDKIVKLKQIALYCVDEIRKQDIKKAQDLGIGIVLVSSKKYLENKEYYSQKYKNLENIYEYNYFNGLYNKEEFEAKR